MHFTENDPSFIRSIIEGQLIAFQNDDAEAAFAFASPGIQTQFKTPAMFMQMVKTAYKPVYRPRSVIFEEMTIIEGFLTQPVLLMSTEGVPVRALYVMEKQPDSSWKINGCFLVPVERNTIF